MQVELLQQKQRMELVSEVTLKIRQSLQLQEILSTIVVGAQRILNTDRVLIYHVLPDRTGKTISESVLPEYPALMAQEFPAEVFPENYQQLYSQGRVRAIADVHDPASGLADCLVEFVAQFGVQAKLIVPIVQTLRVQWEDAPLAQNRLWGLLIAHHCRSARRWVEFERELMQQLADQISIALLQTQLLENLGTVVAAHNTELKAVNHHWQQETHVRLQAESDLRQRQEQLQRKDELISIISHELRTSLTCLDSALKILATGQVGHLSSEGQQMLAIADASTERMLRLVNHVLDLQRIESGKDVMERQVCNAANLIMQAAAAMQAVAQQHGVTVVTQAEEITIWADADYMLQTLINLLSNAIKFSAPGDTVWLTVSLNEPARWHPQQSGHDTAEASDSTQHTNAEAVFRVRDQGPGIPADQLERIFERFQQVDASDSRQKGGTGLGLAICRKIVEHHQGRIWAESTPGQGSTFTFTIPALTPANLQ